MKARSNPLLTRRDAIKAMAGTAGGLSIGGRLPAQPAEPAASSIQVDPTLLHELSPYLFMQFMGPRGATDSSVEAAWDHWENAWRSDVVQVTRDLAPPLLRWGGCFSSYYRWKEAVGPRDQRKPMYNLLWGGMESNQIGTSEFVDFCRRTGAEPLMCVNFESDGRRPWMKDPVEQSRFADAEEAAEWVRYCNDPDNPLRIRHGRQQPHPINMWQIGNETSYDTNGYDCETAAAKTVAFAQAMRKADPAITLIGWGDSGWAPRMLDIAGDHLQYIAFHHMFDPDNSSAPVLRGELYRQDPDRTWAQLMDAWKISDRKIRRIRNDIANHKIPLAMTECHFTIPGRNRCDVLSTWAAGVSYARMFNNFQRHGDVLKIATAADFCGNRWQVNAVMIPTPKSGDRAYLMPVARVMRLYRHHIGRYAVAVKTSNSELDVVASRTDNTVYLHVVNTNRTRAIRVSAALADSFRIREARRFAIADSTMAELSHLNSSRIMQVSEQPLRPDEVWEFPPASVCAVEVVLA